MTTWTAHFTPEAWQHDQAVEVDPEGPAEWDCTAWVRQHPDYMDRITMESGGDLADGVLDRDDLFWSDPAAPQWIREWQGPSTIRVRRGGQQP